MTLAVIGWVGWGLLVMTRGESLDHLLDLGVVAAVGGLAIATTSGIAAWLHHRTARALSARLESAMQDADNQRANRPLTRIGSPAPVNLRKR